ncbi:MAG TPA: GNAT family N-acetyltransferase [Trinickia sp.]|jgi:ribosomal protein S18 acetylase RimI-like enzyme|uniref:GNAT family N-acetyltransferase n=1 Tax=Trinickia sp. TaxID=2571163 RepID=UPI002BBFA0B0|nr:GNAT family N-acetyltransferase [Trinickia sp.]HVW53960.1 GNAT family N-acetyltransferase [Trinickia sp.]
MDVADYDTVIELMRATPGVSLRDADSRESTARYLARNPGLSFVAQSGSDVIGCIMCGHDGRRGYLQHLLVHPDHRRKGVGNALVERTLTALDVLGIHKSHIDVYKTNASAAAFWRRIGWALRTDIDRYSVIRGGGHNA